MENRGDVLEWLPHANCVENVHGNIVPINAKNGLNKKLFINKHEQNETRRESPKKDIPENTDNNDDQVPKYLQIK